MIHIPTEKNNKHQALSYKNCNLKSYMVEQRINSEV